MIGAGFAGLAAADALVEAGVDVTVLEARDRVGGRVHSRRLANGAVVEMGADFFEADHYVLRGYAERFGLTIVPRGMRYSEREPRGVETTPDAVGAVAEMARGMVLRRLGGEPPPSVARCSTRSTSTRRPRGGASRGSRCRPRTAPTRSTRACSATSARATAGRSRTASSRATTAIARGLAAGPRRPRAPVDAGRVDRPGTPTASACPHAARRVHRRLRRRRACPRRS